ncbi:DUF768 domain-containing protein [Mesorhizobium sp. CCANP35]|uniref:DUF768 domain-containing protein n=1 Tax=Mesorhizobium neociceri TaxID=1307853 RepID=A0A838BG51_9HYPH|nr:DUF768 domain-containing protein [Mesorhizobium neociceri]
MRTRGINFPTLDLNNRPDTSKADSASISELTRKKLFADAKALGKHE